MKTKIIIQPKETIENPEGRVLAERLRSIGFPEVKDARVGSYIELELASGDRINAEQRVKKMCDMLLANTLVEEAWILDQEDE